eukprot:CAMPEP_0172535870 /NCGR_PEP_ID=MMETSP1067-20121228/7708_1 /TAXON_ID=265564 ORGANISM="Thalassiosira punctigera, Strain Tpunct2005C2" /NCGR_SAMPLE_ID=MMETSP1067 /ASSEMBLY_ACC=CAM_ASM_000444 /LENGTH=84 /DNA_ID=CAMNT_0013320829 /DNA_START=41 /DNA_END=292 /DNA_ORIENTATION=+
MPNELACLRAQVQGGKATLHRASWRGPKFVQDDQVAKKQFTNCLRVGSARLQPRQGAPQTRRKPQGVGGRSHAGVVPVRDPGED